MPRYRLILEYDGAGLVGWQRQANGLSVQQALETAILAFCGERVTVFGAGRTDAGVHAEAQVAHVDLAKDWECETVRDAINFHLRPQPVVVLTAERAAPYFDARFSAVKRHYLYRIVNRRADLALDQNRAWRVPRPLNADAMHAAAQRLVGHHDFTTFRSAEILRIGSDGSVTSRFAPQPEHYVGQFSRFYRALRCNAELPVTLADARASLEWITAMYYSARTHEAVDLPLDSSHPYYAGWQPKNT